MQQLIAEEKLADLLRKKYPDAHAVRTDKALYDYVLEIKNQYLLNAGQLSRFDYLKRLHNQHIFNIQHVS